MRLTNVLIMLLLVALQPSCNRGMQENDVNIVHLNEIPIEKLETLSQKRYFFGHQSVGRNLIEGLRMVLAEHPEVKIAILDSETGESVKPGTFMHFNVGKNKIPETKIDHFESILESGVGNKVDAAFLKFCFVDLMRNQDPNVLFAQYQSSVEVLKSKYPKTTFVHFTLPLRTVPTGIKVMIKDLIGRDIPQRVDNVIRGRYNELLRTTYGRKEPVFDIARMESIDPSTSMAYQFTHEGESYESMAPSNTNDGGHLSDSGKRWIAEQLIVFLANL